MPVTDVHKDPEARTMTITAEFDAAVDRVWQVWADPRQLEGWWGPPTYPATFVDHDLTPGSHMRYYMTGPEGDQAKGWWQVIDVDPPRHLALRNGFADDEGNPKDDLPTTVLNVALDDRSEGGTRMTIETSFASQEDMEKMFAMGFDEGLPTAAGQIDDLLASEVSSA